MSGDERPATAPAVTVVVIVYNDEDRLPAAVRSVLAQSVEDLELVIVDDASTDRSAAVARRFAARHPGRVRVVRLETNSGGCSGPRNTGIEHARGEYVMFLDSDDTYEPGACATLLGAAQSTGADLVAGRCVRVYADDGTESQWCPKLFEAPAVYHAVRDNPDLLNDTLSTNKLYRRDFLDRACLRFAEGLHYEDLLFSAQAYLDARAIALVPDRVYNWTATRRSARTSITASRAELRNFVDRVEVHRRVDALLLARGCVDLKLHKDVKFINHDLQLYAADLRVRGTVYRSRFQAVAEAYLAELAPCAFEEAKTVHGITAFLLLAGDTEKAMAAADFAGRKGRRGRLLTDLVGAGDRLFWCAEHVDTELGRAQLDVTDLGLADTDLDEIELGNELTTMAVTDRRVHLGGAVVNPLGRIGADGQVGGELEVYDVRHPGRHVRVPVEVRRGTHRLHWDVDFDVTDTVRPLGVVDPAWGMRLWVHTADASYPTRITADRVYAGAQLVVRPRIGRAVGDHLETRLTDGGLLGLRLVARGAVGRATLGAGRWLARTRPGRRLFTGAVGAERKLVAFVRRGGTRATARADAGSVPIEP